jgi:hypothetical protein
MSFGRRSKDRRLQTLDAERAKAARNQAEFLASRLPLKAMATLTWPTNVGLIRADSDFADWVEYLQANHKMTMGWIKAVEIKPRRHLHAILVAAAAVDCGLAMTTWKRIAGTKSNQSALVESFLKGGAGLAYTMKMLDRPSEDIAFSQNLSAFDQNFMGAPMHKNAADRRQTRRIQAAIAVPIVGARKFPGDN